METPGRKEDSARSFTVLFDESIVNVIGKIWLISQTLYRSVSVVPV